MKPAPPLRKKLACGSGTIAVVASRFNGDVVNGLLEGAMSALEENGWVGERVRVVRVSGAWEIPWTCARLCGTGRFRGVVALGCIIEGDTPHFDHVCRAAMDGCLRVMLDTGVPITSGIVTTHTEEQARERSGQDTHNRGRHAVHALLDLLAVEDGLHD